MTWSVDVLDLIPLLEERQADVDQWIEQYNNQRTHSGRYCYGKPPSQTFQDSVQLAKDKIIGFTVQTAS